LKSGKYRERFLMKRRGNIIDEDKPSVELDVGTSDGGETGWDEARDGRVFLLEDGRLKPFMLSEYTASTLYQVVDSFQVESKLVRPEEPGNLVFEGKRPSKKSVPVLITKGGGAVLYASWEDLEANPNPLSEAGEVVGVVPVRQVFVLKRK
jgi:hypothetical protein